MSSFSRKLTQNILMSGRANFQTKEQFKNVVTFFQRTIQYLKAKLEVQTHAPNLCFFVLFVYIYINNMVLYCGLLSSGLLQSGPQPSTQERSLTYCSELGALMTYMHTDNFVY